MQADQKENCNSVVSHGPLLALFHCQAFVSKKWNFTSQNFTFLQIQCRLAIDKDRKKDKCSISMLFGSLGNTART